jgi:hypothetical protein
MDDHLHTGPVQLGVTALAVLLLLNLWRIVAAWAASQSNPLVNRAGTAAGALVHFGA